MRIFLLDICCRNHFSRFQLDINNSLGRKFKIEKGVAQGCVLSPLFFNIYIDDLLARFRECPSGVELENLKLNAFSFADDLVLVANKKEELSQLFEILTSWCDENHFQINTKKSGVFITGEEQDKFFLGEEEIPQLETLKYLGIEIEKNGSYNKYLTRICAQTRATLQQFHSLLSRYDLAFCIRLRLARSLRPRNYSP